MNKDVIQIEDRTVGVDELVDSVVAGKITGLSERTIRDKAVNREFPIYKLSSRCTKYLVRDLLDWCESRRVEPTIGSNS